MAENAIVMADLKQELSADSSSMFCSLQGGTRAEKARVYNAMNNPEHKVADCINKTINVKDVLAEYIEVGKTDSEGKPVVDENGEQVMDTVPRVVLIDDKGEAYQAVSVGIFNAVKKAIAVFGAPTWDEPLPITVKQISLGTNKMLTFDVDVK